MTRCAPWLLLLLPPLLVHAPLWLLGRSADPIYLTSGLATEAPVAWQPGPPGWVDPNAGFTTAALGGFAARQWLHGIVPWWNPFAGVGMSLAAEAQPAPLFLPYTLLLALPAGVVWNKIALQITAGFATFALLRQLDLMRWVALLGAVLFELNGTFAWYAHAPINPVPFLPLLLLGIERAAGRARAGRPGGWGWITVGLAASLYAGFPETAFIDGLFAALWAGWAVRSTARTARGRAAGKIALGGGLGLLLAGPAVLPFLQALPAAETGFHDAMGTWPMVPSLWLQVPAPYAEGPTGEFATGYVGLALAWLALLALARPGPRDGRRWLLAGWLLLAIGKAAQLPVLHTLFDVIPFISRTAFPHYAMPSAEMACLILGCLAVDDWARLGAPPRRAALLAGAGALLLLGRSLWLARGALAALEGPVRTIYPLASMLAALAVLAVAAALVRRRPTRGRRLWLGGVVSSYAAALFALRLLSATSAPPLDRALVVFLGEHLGLARFYTLGPVWANWGTWFGLPTINHNALPVPRAWVDYIHHHLDPGADGVGFVGWYPPPAPGQESRAEAMARRLPAFEAVGVRYVVAPRGSAPFTGTQGVAPPLVFQSTLADIYELPHPTAYFATRGAACVLTPRKREAVAADCAAPATLVRLELFDAGWRARVNGAAASVVPIDEIFQAVALPAGRSEVRFSYAPPFIGWACAGALLGLAGLAAGLWRGRER